MTDFKQRLGDFSIREKNLWFEFIVDIMVALYYYPAMFSLLLRGDGALSGEAMTEVIVNTVVYAVVVSVLISIFLHTQTKPEPRDERDYLIEAKSNLWFSRALVFGVLAVMGTIMFHEFNPWSSEALLPMTPLVIAHLLLFVLMVASMVNSVLKLAMYRIGA